MIKIMDKPEIPQKSPFVQEVEPGIYAWCACGKSSNQPFCDGSHSGTGMSPKKVTIEKRQKVAWCGCKYSENKPFCDGSHKNL